MFGLHDNLLKPDLYPELEAAALRERDREVAIRRQQKRTRYQYRVAFDALASVALMALIIR